MLLEHNVPISVKNKNGQTALNIAEESHCDELKAMLKAKIKERKEFNSLMNSCSRGDLDGVKTILKRWSQVNATNENGDSPLIVSCESEHVYIVDCLLKHGADINYQNCHKKRALDIAVGKGNSKLVEVLLRHEPSIFPDKMLLDKWCSLKIKTMLKKYIADNPDALLINHDGRLSDYIFPCLYNPK